MRSVRESSDLTSRARIRDAAIRRFAMDGTAASLRTIAADAGVSAGLILHHFGSRAGLREECDRYVVEQIGATKSAVLGPTGGTGAFLAYLAQIEGYAPLVGYALRSVQTGGPMTKNFVDRLVDDAVAYLDEGVAAGSIRPSRDPHARARMLAEMTLGALLLQMPAREERLDLDEFPTWLAGYFERIMPPLLEMMTEGVMADSTLLDAYLDTVSGADPRTSS